MKKTGEKCSLDKQIQKVQMDYASLAMKMKLMEVKIAQLIAKRYERRNI